MARCGRSTNIVVGPLKYRNRDARTYRTRRDPFESHWPEMCHTSISIPTKPRASSSPNSNHVIQTSIAPVNPDSFELSSDACKRGEPKPPDGSSSGRTINPLSFSHRPQRTIPKVGRQGADAPFSPRPSFPRSLWIFFPEGRKLRSLPSTPPSVTSYVRQPVTELREAIRTLLRQRLPATGEFIGWTGEDFRKVPLEGECGGPFGSFVVNERSVYIEEDHPGFSHNSTELQRQ